MSDVTLDQEPAGLPPVSLIKHEAEQPEGEPADNAAAPNGGFVLADHAHVYGYMDLCIVDGCDRIKPLWLTDTERQVASYAPVAKRAEGRFAAFKNQPGWVKFIVLGGAYLALLGALGSVAAGKITGPPDGTPTRPTIVRVP